MDFFGKAHDVADRDLGPVVEDGFSRHTSEYLMLIGGDNLEIHARGPVKNRLESHLKSAV